MSLQISMNFESYNNGLSVDQGAEHFFAPIEIEYPNLLSVCCDEQNNCLYFSLHGLSVLLYNQPSYTLQ